MNDFAFNMPLSGANFFAAGLVLLVQNTAAATGILVLAGATVLTLRKQSAAMRHRIWFWRCWAA